MSPQSVDGGTGGYSALLTDQETRRRRCARAVVLLYSCFRLATGQPARDDVMGQSDSELAQYPADVRELFFTYATAA